MRGLVAGGALFGLKPSHLFYIMGLILCAMPCRIYPETRLNAAPLSGIPGGETNEKGNADSPIKAARRDSLDNKRDYHITMIIEGSANAVRGLRRRSLPHIFDRHALPSLPVFADNGNAKLGFSFNKRSILYRFHIKPEEPYFLTFVKNTLKK